MEANDRDEKEFSRLHVAMTIVSRIQEGDRLFTGDHGDFQIQAPTVINWLWRSLTPQSRSTNIQRVRERFSEVKGFCTRTIEELEQGEGDVAGAARQTSLFRLRTLLDSISSAATGLHRLKTTYSGDEQTCCMILSQVTCMRGFLETVKHSTTESLKQEIGGMLAETTTDPAHL